MHLDEAMTHDGPVENLRVLVPAELIGDGQISFPEVGDQVEYALTFVETRAEILPERRNDITARVEMLNNATVSPGRADRDGHIRPGTYSMLLHGQGWVAHLRSATRYRGTVHLTGSMTANFPALIPEKARTRGTITARHLLRHTSWPGPNGRYSRDGVYSVGPVRVGQQGFADGLVPAAPNSENDSWGWVGLVRPPEGPWIQEVGVLVELRPAS